MNPDLQTVLLIILGIGFLAMLAALPYAMKLLAQSVPPDIATKLAALVPPDVVEKLLKQAEQRVLQAGLDAAKQTPSDLDDEFWKQISAMRGATVTPLPDGGYTISISNPPTYVPVETSSEQPKSGIEIYDGTAWKPMEYFKNTQWYPSSSTSTGGNVKITGITFDGQSIKPLEFPNTPHTPTNTPS